MCYENNSSEHTDTLNTHDVEQLLNVTIRRLQQLWYSAIVLFLEAILFRAPFNWLHLATEWEHCILYAIMLDCYQNSKILLK